MILLKKLSKVIKEISDLNKNDYFKNQIIKYIFITQNYPGTGTYMPITVYKKKVSKFEPIQTTL